MQHNSHQVSSRLYIYQFLCMFLICRLLHLFLQDFITEQGALPNVFTVCYTQYVLYNAYQISHF